MTTADKKSVLIIDDDDFVRSMVLKLVETFGYTATGARDGVQALEMLATMKTPSVVITDMVMPKKDGVETVKELRIKFPRLKIIAVSGGGRTEQGDHLELARKAGADEIISKPIDPKQLKAVLRLLMERE